MYVFLVVFISISSITDSKNKNYFEIKLPYKSMNACLNSKRNIEINLPLFFTIDAKCIFKYDIKLQETIKILINNNS